VTTVRALALSVAVSRTKLLTALTKGLRLTTGCGEPCTIAATLVLPAKLARQLHLKRTVATGRLSATGASGRLTLRFTRAARRALAKLRTVKATLVLTGTGSGARKATLRRSIQLRR
jgi:hypothetical protein